MAITISKKFSILVDSEAMLKELNCDKTVSQITANVDYFYRSPERFEACAELDITISKIEIEVNIGQSTKERIQSFDCEQYCARFGFDEDEFVDELKSSLESKIRGLNMNKIEDGDEVEIVFDDTENPHGTENFTVEVRFGKGDDANKRTKQFNTKAELDAYLEGLSDMDGYSCFEIL